MLSFGVLVMLRRGGGVGRIRADGDEEGPIKQWGEESGSMDDIQILKTVQKAAVFPFACETILAIANPKLEDYVELSKVRFPRNRTCSSKNRTSCCGPARSLSLVSPETRTR